ncbi:hypothetical protein HYR54_09305 [Candidatus Acetothermia bacterium]|nr:hypothetical protein [Candidatus Acetothermia bacterium]
MDKIRFFLFGNVGFLALTLLLSGCTQQIVAPPTGVPPLTYVIDPSVQPVPNIIPDQGKGPRPLAAVVDDKGVRSVFVADEVLLLPKDQTALQDFLTRYKGVIIGDTSVPLPPPGVQARQSSSPPKWYLIRLDPAQFSLKNFVTDAALMGVHGASKISSDNGAKLLALVAHERAGGTEVSVNFAAQSYGYLYSTTEQADDSGVSDAFK